MRPCGLCRTMIVCSRSDGAGRTPSVRPFGSRWAEEWREPRSGLNRRFRESADHGSDRDRCVRTGAVGMRQLTRHARTTTDHAICDHAPEPGIGSDHTMPTRRTGGDRTLADRAAGLDHCARVHGQQRDAAMYFQPQVRQWKPHHRHREPRHRATGLLSPRTHDRRAFADLPDPRDARASISPRARAGGLLVSRLPAPTDDHRWHPPCHDLRHVARFHPAPRTTPGPEPGANVPQDSAWQGRSRHRQRIPVRMTTSRCSSGIRNRSHRGGYRGRPVKSLRWWFVSDTSLGSVSGTAHGRRRVSTLGDGCDER